MENRNKVMLIFFQIETVKFINAGLISSESAEAEK